MNLPRKQNLVLITIIGVLMTIGFNNCQRSSTDNSSSLSPSVSNQAVLGYGVTSSIQQAWAADSNAPPNPAAITTSFTQPGNTDLIMFMDATNYYPYSISKGKFQSGGTMAHAWGSQTYAPKNTATLKGAFNLGQQTIFFDTTYYYIYDWTQSKFLAPPVVNGVTANTMVHAWSAETYAPKNPAQITLTFTELNNSDVIVFLDATNYYPYSISKGHFQPGGTLASTWGNFAYAPKNLAALKNAFSIGNQTIFIDSTYYYIYNWSTSQFLPPPSGN